MDGLVKQRTMKSLALLILFAVSTVVRGESVAVSQGSEEAESEEDAVALVAAASAGGAAGAT